MALEEKKRIVLDKWINDKLPGYYIMIDDVDAKDCDQLNKWKKASAQKAF
jgi:hypothetical protein